MKERVERFKSWGQTLNQLSSAMYDIALSNGFHKKDEPFGVKIALIHSELSEALEAHRTRKRASPQAIAFVKAATISAMEKFSDYTGTYTSKDRIYEIESYLGNLYAEGIKDTVEDELADALIRILDLAVELNIDLGFHVVYKSLYNISRPYKHGKEY